MNEETTRMLSDEERNSFKNKMENVGSNKEEVINTACPSQSKSKRKSKTSGASKKAAAAAVGGLVGGVAVGTAVPASASETEKTELDIENIEDEKETPDPADIILANDEGVRYAHVEADNFNEAFAQARQQVGPGGVFEYEGKLYGTFYADEWNNMSEDERVDFQHRVMEIPAEHSTSHESTLDVVVENEPTVISDVQGGDLVSEDPSDSEIHVVGIDTIEDSNGETMNVALVEAGGDYAILADVDGDGAIDVVVYDENGNGVIEPEEAYPVQAEIQMDDLADLYHQQQGGGYFAASDDGMADFANDCDSVMNV